MLTAVQPSDVWPAGGTLVSCVCLHILEAGSHYEALENSLGRPRPLARLPLP